MKIKRNEDLLFEVYKYASRLTEMAKMVEKDREITKEEYDLWAKKGLNNINDIKKWMVKISNFIKENSHEQAG